MKPEKETIVKVLSSGDLNFSYGGICSMLKKEMSFKLQPKAPQSMVIFQLKFLTIGAKLKLVMYLINLRQISTSVRQ